MSATLTKESVRVHVATRLAARLRHSRNYALGRMLRDSARVRTRITDDGLLVGRSIITLPFDVD